MPINTSSVSFNDSVELNLPEFCNLSSILDLRSSDEDSISRYFYSTGEIIVILGFYPVTLLIGLVANIAFLLVLLQIPDMRTVTNAYLGNLALADLLLLCSADYHFLIAYFLSPKVKLLPYNYSIGMAINVTIQYMSHFTSIALVFFVTIERYLGICKPLYQGVVVRKGRTCILIVSAWVFGLIYSCAFVAPRSYVLVKTCVLWPEGDKYDDLPTLITSRSPIHPFYKNMPEILQMFPFSFAVICNTCMYWQIVRELHLRVSLFDETVQIAKVRNQVARLLIANGVVFFLCYIPFYISRFNDSLLVLTHQNYGFEMSASQRGAVDWMVVCLLTINSIINPIIYGITNQRYRRAFVHVFSCRSLNRICRTLSLSHTPVDTVHLQSMQGASLADTTFSSVARMSQNRP